MSGVEGMDGEESRKRILEFIRSHWEKQGFAPSIREIADAVGLHSTSSVHAHLRVLKHRGQLRWVPGLNRTIQVQAQK